MTISEQIQQLLEATKNEIQRRMKDKGMNATGRTSLSIRIERDGSKIMLKAGGDSPRWGGRTAPVESLELGRGPGGDYLKLRPIIVKWTVDKGWRFPAPNTREEESHRWAVSTIIARHIVAEGTRRYRKNEDVYSTPVNEAAGKIREIVTSGVNAIIHDAIAAEKIQTIKTNF